MTNPESDDKATLAAKHTELAEQCLREGQLAEARRHVALALEQSPQSPQAILQRALLHRAEGSLEAARLDLDTALALAPDLFAAHLERSKLRRGTGDPAGAVRDADAALRLRPLSARAMLERGMCRHAMGDLGGALEDYTAAIHHNPTLQLAYISRGQAYYHKRRVSESRADFEHAFAMNPQGYAETLGGRIWSRALANGEAILLDCGRHLTRNSKDYAAHVRRGLTLLSLGRDEEAQADLDQAMALEASASKRITALIEVIRRLRGSSAGRGPQAPVDDLPFDF